MPVRIDGLQDWRFDASVMRAHERIGKGVRSGVGIVLNLLLPPQCLACRAAVDRPGALCAECWNGTAFIEPPICGRCGLPFEVDEGEDVLCGACLDAPPDFDGARAALRYEGVGRDLVPGFKLSDRTYTAPALAG